LARRTPDTANRTQSTSRRLTTRVSAAPRSGVAVAGAEGAPLADRVTPKLVGCIRWLGAQRRLLAPVEDTGVEGATVNREYPRTQPLEASHPLLKALGRNAPEIARMRMVRLVKWDFDPDLSAQLENPPNLAHGAGGVLNVFENRVTYYPIEHGVTEPEVHDVIMLVDLG
jgi:hypothetical protein